MSSESSDTTNALGVACAAVLVIPVVMLISAFVSGWSLMHLWNWFIVPLGAVEITSIWWAYGIGLVVGLFTYTRVDAKKREGVEVLTRLLFVLGWPLVLVGLGWIVVNYLWVM